MRRKKAGRILTFGGLVENFCDTCGERKAQGLLRLAIKANWVIFRGSERYVFGRGTGKA
jgi:ribosome biogenesis protein Nip4